MAFWTDATNKDPKRQYRFLVTLGNMPNGATWYAKSVKKPEITISTSEHDFLNHKFYYPGRAEWAQVDVVLVDPVSPDAAANTAAIIRASGYTPPMNVNDVTTMSKQASVAALGTVVITQIDSEGNSLETWTLWNPFIISATFGDLDYSADDLTEVSIGIRYDWAILETAVASETGLASDGNTFFKPGT